MKHLILTLVLISSFIAIGQSNHGQDKSPLQTAIESKNIAKVKELISSGADVNEEGNWRETPIEWAIKVDDITIVKYLLSHGASSKRGMEDAIKNGNQAMVSLLIENKFYLTYSAIYAAEKNNLELLKLLVNNGAPVNESQKRKKRLFSKYYVSAIEFATENKNTEMALFLIEEGVSVHTAIDEAIANKHNDLLKTLIIKGEEKDNILAIAVKYSNDEIINYAIENGANAKQINKEGQTLLHLAAATGSISNIRRCAEEFKIDINALSNINETALMLASKTDQYLAAEYLISQEAKIEIENIKGETALFYAARGNSLKTFELLVSQGADVNHRDKDGNTVLMEATKSDKPYVISSLLQKGVDINVQNNENFTAFHYAVGKANSSSINQFLEKGADINTKNAESGESLMYLAIEQEKLDRIKELQAQGADLNVLDKRGSRPRNDNKEVIMYLVENGVSIDAVNSRHDSFLCDAIADNDLELIHFLVSKGADVNQNCYFEEPPIIKAIKKENLTIISFLVDNNADVNAIGYFDRNVAEYAEKKGNQEIITYLKEHGALTQKDKNELFQRSMQMESELKSALQAENENLLISHLKKCDGLTIQSSLIKQLVLFTCKSGNLIIMELITAKLHYDLETTLNSEKQTALFIATINDKKQLVSYLIGKGSDTIYKDKQGKTAANYAKGKDMKRVFKN